MMRLLRKSLPLILIVLAGILFENAKTSFAKNAPTPSGTYNYYYYGNWYYDLQGPAPRSDVGTESHKGNTNKTSAKNDPTPGVAQNNESAAAKQENNGNQSTEHHVIIDKTVATRGTRDIFDWVFLAFTAALALGTFLQIITYVTDHRPHIVIRHIAFATKQDDIFIVDESSGNIKCARADFTFIIGNEGATRGTVVERNITLKPVGRADSIEDILRSIGRGDLPLPEFDDTLGLPVYDTTGTIIERVTLGPDDRRALQISKLSRSINEAVDMYLSLSANRGVEHMRFFVLGYFKYRDRICRWHTTAFCRLYDRSSGRFTPIDDSRYEYRT